MSKKKILALSSFLLCIICLLSGCGRVEEVSTAEPPKPSITADPVEIKDTEDTQDTQDTQDNQDNQAPAVDTVSDPISGEPSGPLDTEETSQVEQINFIEVNETVYATAYVNIRSEPSVSSNKLGSLSQGQSVTRTGQGQGEADGWSRVSLSDGTTAYISSKYLSTTKPTAQSSSGGSNHGGSTSQGSSGQGSSGQGGSSQGSSSFDDIFTDPEDIPSHLGGGKTGTGGETSLADEHPNYTGTIGG